MKPRENAASHARLAMVAGTRAAPAVSLDEGIAAVRLLQATQRECRAARIEHEPAIRILPHSYPHDSPPDQSARVQNGESAAREAIGSTSVFAR
jgi:hypothetical protein